MIYVVEEQGPDGVYKALCKDELAAVMLCILRSNFWKNYAINRVPERVYNIKRYTEDKEWVKYTEFR